LMVLGVGCCHPVAEQDPNYDGLYLRSDEMRSFAAELRGKPVYLEHQTEHPVGKIDHAWVSGDDALQVLFETDDSGFAGHLAANVIKKGLCAELSLGHDCKIAHSAEGSMQVVGKRANEVSIVVKGARPNTHIHAWGRNVPPATAPQPGLHGSAPPNLVERRGGGSDHATDLPPSPALPPTATTARQYISTTAASGVQPTAHAMSSEPNADAPNAEAEPIESTNSAPSSSATDEMPTSVLNELRQQSTVNAQMQSQLAALQQQLQGYQQVGQKRRQETLDGAVKDWVKQILSTHQKELGQYEDKYAEMFKAMQANEEAEPMVQLLSCAAAKSAASTAAFEKKYQEAQRENKRLRTQIDAAQPAFSKSAERFAPTPPPSQAQNPVAPTDAYNRMFAPPTAASQARGGGMRAVNPSLWDTMTRRARTMPGGGPKQRFDTSLYSDTSRVKLGW